VAALNPLVSTEWLADRLYDESLRVVDCRFYLAEPDRGREEYLAGHIPTAFYVSLDDDLTGVSGPGRHPLPDASAFKARMGQIGIGSEHTVVVYDDQGAGYSARLWWMLRSRGHDRVHVLDGGWGVWSEEPRSVTTEIPVWQPTVFAGSPEWTGIISREQIVASDNSVLLIDARNPERYRGEIEPIDPVAGHIPGAYNIPYADNVGDDGRFLETAALEERFAIAANAGTIVAYCGSGVTACNNLLAMAIVGHTDALRYPGSWSDWCGNGGEVATTGHTGQSSK
jgi:thiosulfate/3-mercaptopyruvate sulfurtransferase